jgi:hypothetical protein
MSEFEAYLAQLRAHLDVSAPRAEEIIAETYSHLEEHARQLMESGLSREEAVRAAEQALGDPAALAAQLTRANGRHRDATVFHTLAGVGVMLTALFSLGPGEAWDLWRCAAADLAGLHSTANADGLAFVLLALALTPAALAAGAIGGRRRWWVALTPPAFPVVLFWGVALLQWQLPYGAVHDQLRYAALYPLLGALVLAPAGYLGGRLSRSPRARRAVVAAACLPYALVTAASVAGVADGALAGAGYGDALTAVALGAATAVTWLLGAYDRHRADRSRLLLPFVLACALTILALGVVATTVPMAPALSGVVFGLELTAVAMLAAAAAAAGLRLKVAGRHRRPVE